MNRTSIEWTEYTWNPVTGCSKMSEGCQHCYAERIAKRLAGRGGYPADEPFRVTLHPERLDEPLRVQKPQRVFVSSMGDLFHPKVPETFISAVFYVMQKAKQHTFLVLTKRPKRMAEFVDRWIHCDNAYPMHAWQIGADSAAGRPLGYGHYRRDGQQRPPLPNVWLGVTAENQARADERIPILLQIPAAVRFVSVEPMLGPVDLGKYFIARQMTCKACGHTFWSYEAEFCEGHLVYHCGCRGFADECHCKYSRTLKCPRCGKCVCDRVKKWAAEGRLQKESGRYAWVLDRDKWQRLDWVICGGETGPGARPMHPDWVRSLRDQCQAAGVPFLFKQWGEFCYPSQMPDDTWRRVDAIINLGCHADEPIRVGKRAAGRLLDGQIWDQYPNDRHGGESA